MSEKYLAEEGCYGCHGTGFIVWARVPPNTKCSCVAACSDCDEPFAWEHDDEHPPKYCPKCEAES